MRVACGKEIQQVARAEGQDLGAATMGIGVGVVEELIYDGQQLTNGSLLEYRVPRFSDLARHGVPRPADRFGFLTIRVFQSNLRKFRRNPYCTSSVSPVSEILRRALACGASLRAVSHLTAKPSGDFPVGMGLRSHRQRRTKCTLSVCGRRRHTAGRGCRRSRDGRGVQLHAARTSLPLVLHGTVCAVHINGNSSDEIGTLRVARASDGAGAAGQNVEGSSTLEMIDRIDGPMPQDGPGKGIRWAGNVIDQRQAYIVANVEVRTCPEQSDRRT
jgi:hypothetical protein